MAFDYMKLMSIFGGIIVVGILMVYMAIKVKGKKIGDLIPKPFFGLIGVVLILGGGYSSGAFPMFMPKETTNVPAPLSAAVPNTPAPAQNLANQANNQVGEIRNVGGRQCLAQPDGKNSLDLAVRNSENATLAYLGASITAESNDKTTLDSATATGGATLSYTTLNVEPCQQGMVYVLATSGVGIASARIPFDSFGLTFTETIDGASSNVISVQGRSSSLATASSGLANSTTTDPQFAVSGATTSDGTAYFTNTTLGAGGTINGYLDWTVNGTATVFGTVGADDGVVFSYDSGTASVFSQNSFSFSDQFGMNLREAPCSTTITANRNAEKCWAARTLKQTDGEMRTKFTLKADNADPGVSTTAPRLCIDDKVYFRDTNGKVAYDFFSSSGVGQGAGGTCIVFPVN